jgi:dihydrofolate reductase
MTTIKASVYIATSIDGFIARPNGDIDWLTVDELAGEDYGYQAFIDTVDVLVMGRHSFEKVLSFGVWPYEGKRVVVLSSRQLELPEHLSGKVEALNLSPPELTTHLAAQGATHLYIDGGQTIRGFLQAGLIDQLIITRIPILIGEGIPLFGSLPSDIKLKHLETQTFQNGLVQSRYAVI